MHAGARALPARTRGRVRLVRLDGLFCLPPSASYRANLSRHSFSDGGSASSSIPRFPCLSKNGRASAADMARYHVVMGLQAKSSRDAPGKEGGAGTPLAAAARTGVRALPAVAAALHMRFHSPRPVVRSSARDQSDPE